MSKINLPDIGSLANNASARQAINDNFAQIEQAFENTLSRDGTLPNQMGADIDLNGNDLLNANRVDAAQYFLNGVPLEQQVAYGSKEFQLFTGTGVQTDFNLLSDPGSLGNLYVAIDGVTQTPGIDYTYTGQTLTFSEAPILGKEIYVRFDIALSGTTGAGSAITFLQEGVGAITRSVQDRLRDTVSVKDYGARGDGSQDDTAAIQAAINFVESKTISNFWGEYYGAVYLPPGNYVVSGLQINKPVVLFGDSPLVCTLSLANNSNKSVIAVAAVADAVPTNDPFRIAPVLKGFAIDGNAAQQAVTSHGIEISDSPRPIAVRYDGGAVIQNVIVRGVRDAGLYLGANRNNGYIEGVSVVYSGTYGCQNFGYDWRIVSCDFGNSAHENYFQVAGGATSMFGTYMYIAGDAPGATIGPFCNAPCMFSGCFFDTNAKEGIYVEAASDLISFHSVQNCTFRDNSTMAFGVHPHIRVVNSNGGAYVNNIFVTNNTAIKPSYLIELSGSSEIKWSGTYEETNASFTPYTIAVTNSYSNLIHVGDRGNSIRKLGNLTMAVYGDAPKWDYVDIGEVANSRRWSTNVDSSFWQLNIVDDAGGSASNVIQAGRSGTTLTSVSMFGGALLVDAAKVQVTKTLIPSTDNTLNLGGGANRWATVFAGTGAINTSDERTKTAIQPVDDALLDAWEEVEWSQFQFKDGKRLHVGLVAQRVEAVFAKHGLDPFAYGLLCHDAWEARAPLYDPEGNLLDPGVEAGDLYGIRYEEALALEAALLRRELRRLKGT